MFQQAGLLPLKRCIKQKNEQKDLLNKNKTSHHLKSNVVIVAVYPQHLPTVKIAKNLLEMYLK